MQNIFTEDVVILRRNYWWQWWVWWVYGGVSTPTVPSQGPSQQSSELETLALDKRRSGNAICVTPHSTNKTTEDNK